MKTNVIRRPLAVNPTFREVMARMPESHDVANVEVGGMAPDCFGKMATVTAVSGRGTDIKGKAFVCYTCAMSDGDTVENGCGCSASMKAGELIRTVALTAILTSAECDALEAEMRN